MKRYFVKIKTPAQKFRKLPLPVTVGSSSNCDVVIVSEVVPKLSQVIGVANGSLAVYNQQATTLSDVSTLERFGLKVIGPVTESDGAKSPLKTLISEAFAVESYFFRKIPQRWRHYLGESLGQARRLSVWGVVLATLILSVVVLDRGETRPNLDLSNQAIVLQSGQIYGDLTGSSATRFGYEKGILYKAAIEKKQAQLLTFDVGGLDEKRELSIQVNSKEIGQLDADPECLKKMCTKSFPVPLKLISNGVNEIRFVRHGQGPYLVSNLSLVPLPSLSPAESLTVDRWIEGAERAYSDRGISLDNVVHAFSLLNKAQSLVSTRLVDSDVRSRIAVLLKKVGSEIKEVTETFWFDSQRSLQLGEFEAAVKSLKSLLILYPNPADPKHREIKAQLKTIEELSK
jgi:hypothetical protein